MASTKSIALTKAISVPLVALYPIPNVPPVDPLDGSSRSIKGPPAGQCHALQVRFRCGFLNRGCGAHKLFVLVNC